MNHLSLKEKIGQLFMAGFYGTEPPEVLESLIREYNIGFVILFSRNIVSVPQVTALTKRLHGLETQTPLFIYADQEGGAIVRFGEMAATVVSAMGLAATGSLEYAQTAGRLIGEDMRTCGIDGVFAPVLDVNVEEENPVIGIRSFSDHPDIVAAYAERFCRGLAETGTLNCGKHFPGHGAASADSHLEIPSIPVSPEYFGHYCFQPFAALARKNIDAFMTAHVLFPQLSEDIATFSPLLIRDLLRKTAGYEGVVFTDCLEMNAVKDNYSPREIVISAMTAGIDVMSVSHTFEFQVELLEALEFYVANGTIEESRIDRSVSRILAMKEMAAKRRRKSKPPQDPPRLRKFLAVEQEIAKHSVTLLRNRSGVLPLDENQSTIVLEFRRRITGPSVAENQEETLVEGLSAQFFKNREYIMIDPGEPLPEEAPDQLADYTNVILCIYSRTGEADRLQTLSLNQLLEIRPDAVIVSLESPYEIKKIPEVDTFLVTYGFREVQIDALFKILTGKTKPTGKLPVEIKYHFPRWFSAQSEE